MRQLVVCEGENYSRGLMIVTLTNSHCGILDSKVINFPPHPPSPVNVSVAGRARGGRTHRDTEEGEAEEQTAKVLHFRVDQHS